ncbi:MAG: methionine biosynthesis protein MetW [Gammaproteobacteria bacterium AqS3]|nr:methionine biosynthesis protein MetW [Gammaproteobacteria bacterium AqS3]
MSDFYAGEKINRRLIVDWVPEGARVLDVGCGSGELLAELAAEKNTRGWGVDNSVGALRECIVKGIPALYHDVDTGLGQFHDRQFDMVITVVSLQQFHRPLRVLTEMLRIGKECILVFPNFGHWCNRLYLMRQGRMPVSSELPYQWHDTPNIHFFTVGDFYDTCAELNIDVLAAELVTAGGAPCRFLGGWRSALAYFKLRRR